MSEKLFDNKHLLHIVAEVVVMCGISFYFSSQIKTLRTTTEELTHKLEDQEDKLQKLNQLSINMNNGMMNYIEKNKEQTQLLMNKISSLEQSLESLSVPVSSSVPVSAGKKKESFVKETKENINQLSSKPSKPSLKTVNPIEKMLMNTMKMMQVPITFEKPMETKIRFSTNIEEEPDNKPNLKVIEEENEDPENDLSDSELDEEIKDELNDLKT